MDLTTKKVITCSHCKCNILESFYSTKRNGEKYKNCDNCRNRYICMICDFKTNKKTDFDRHTSTVHNFNKMKLECISCSYKCKSVNELILHDREQHRSSETDDNY